MRAGGRQLTNLMNKNHKGKNDEQEEERQQPAVVTPYRITNIHFRQRIFILHVCITARESSPYLTLIGSPTRYVFT